MSKAQYTDRAYSTPTHESAFKTQSGFLSAMDQDTIKYLQSVMGKDLTIGSFDYYALNLKAPRGTSLFPTLREQAYGNLNREKLDKQF